MSTSTTPVPPAAPVVVSITVEDVLNKARAKAKFYAGFSGKADHNPYYYIHPLEEICNELTNLDKPTPEQILKASQLVDEVGAKDADGKLLPPHQSTLKIPGIIQQQKIGLAEQALKNTPPAVPPKPIVPVAGLGGLVKIPGVTGA